MAVESPRATTQTPIRTLGEIALCVNDLDLMQRFYTDIVGLEVLGSFPASVFFKISEGYAGHTQILALFHRGRPVSADRSSIDHIAFTVALADLEVERVRLEGLGLRVRTGEHAWVHWRSLYVQDPEGNTVEWVCYDESV